MIVFLAIVGIAFFVGFHLLRKAYKREEKLSEAKRRKEKVEVDLDIQDINDETDELSSLLNTDEESSNE